ncbi:MAG TPA: hypothetical protein VL049_05365 [Candidatus Dormibacteraeota bacterium]|nr:hypothetical protein [Candidatus Dormibacteraeota bacterium]
MPSPVPVAELPPFSKRKAMPSLHLRAKVIIGGVLGILFLILPSPSRAGAGSFVCPNKDLAGRSLGDQSFGPPLFCSFGQGFDCTYNATNGGLEADNDGGNCPANAVGPGGGSFVCPNEDLAGQRLEDENDGTTIFCVYGIGFECIYNMTTGELVTDNDGGHCPANAVVFTGAPTGTPNGAPALTPSGLLAAAGMLAGIAGIALRRRLRGG